MILIVAMSYAILMAAPSERRVYLQSLGSRVQVSPIRVAPAAWVNGDVMIGEWRDFSGSVSGCLGAEFFDCADPDELGDLEDEDGCGMGGDRWFLGPDYCNGMATNDMSTESSGNGRRATHLNFAWYWYCLGHGVEDCTIVILTGEDFTQECGGFDGAYDGVAYDFGSLECHTGAFYYSIVDLTGRDLFHQMPADGSGWYQIRFLTTGNEPATCAQPMLWGTSANRPGDQQKPQWDDDFPRDGQYNGQQECYDYTSGTCPPIFGAMISFGDGSGDCRADACPSVECNGGEALAAKARIKGGQCQVKATIKNATPSFAYGIVMPTGACVVKDANARGKVVVKERPSVGGSVEVPTCGLIKQVACP
ncbi:MAG: hypothetical protein FLDDKLPJ_01678 [Phycisphaerae bacterium]|nr:hypothetical protein [Phycisphaerae bacterium]